MKTGATPPAFVVKTAVLAAGVPVGAASAFDVSTMLPAGILPIRRSHSETAVLVIKVASSFDHTSGRRLPANSASLVTFRIFD